MSKPRALDLFCCAGGSSRGYADAGFTVAGVDIEPQPNYPYDFYKGDVFDVWEWVIEDEQPDLIHASPPCQHHTKYRNAVKDITTRYDDLCLDTVKLIEASGIPGVVENVPGSHLHADLILCGSMFGLDVRRHREFQLVGWDSLAPGGCNHKGWRRRFKSSTGRVNKRYTIEVGSWDESLEDQKAAMGVDWPITVRELSQAVPPAYCKFIGEAFISQLEAVHAQ